METSNTYIPKVLNINSLVPNGLNIGQPMTSAMTPADMTVVWDSLSKNTQRSYVKAKDSYLAAGFRFPCTRHEVLAFIDLLAKGGMLVKSIELRLTGIAFFDRLLGNNEGISDRVVAARLHTLRREQAVETRKAHALSIKELESMLKKLDLSKKSLRDKALILITYYGALRRSEATQICFEDLTFSSEGLQINIKRAKTGINQKVFIPAQMPVLPVLHNLLERLKIDGICTGFIFRGITKTGVWNDHPLSPEVINILLKELAPKAGLNPANISAHSLRAGCTTELFARGVDSFKIQKHGRWSNPTTVAGYYRPHGFSDAALKGLNVKGHKKNNL